jgi:hypothetical protein
MSEVTVTENQAEQNESEDSSNPVMDYNWEKEVERDLMLTLQTWYADSAVRSDRTLDLKSAAADELLAAHSRHFQHPVYFPFAGKVERALGDAMVKAQGLILIECKLKIDKDEWRREAMPETKVKKKVKGVEQISISNKGGKDRLSQLKAVSGALLSNGLDRARTIANQCHVLIGADRSAEQKGPSSLRFTLYWPFIVNGQRTVGVIDPKPLCELNSMHVSFDDFREYVLALAAQRGSTEGATRRLENQFITLVKCEGTWQGHRTTQEELVASIEFANQANIDAAAAAAAEEDALALEHVDQAALQSTEGEDMAGEKPPKIRIRK